MKCDRCGVEGLTRDAQKVKHHPATICPTCTRDLSEWAAGCREWREYTVRNAQVQAMIDRGSNAAIRDAVENEQDAFRAWLKALRHWIETGLDRVYGEGDESPLGANGEI